MKHPPFQSLAEATAFFKAKGFTTEFTIQNDALHDPDTRQQHQLTDAHILLTLKFEDDSDADEVSILHIVETASGLKGQFVDASGMYASLGFSSLK